MVGLGCCLPILPVERADLDVRQVDTVDAADVESPTAWIESRTNEWVDAAMPAEIVLRCFRIELVERQICLAGDDAKVRLRRWMPERALPATDRAIAINSVIEPGAGLECDPTTVACALIGLGHGLQ